MPANPEWLLKVTDIQAQLDALDTPVVDRGMIERIFGVRRRRAIQLMHAFGGYQSGKTFLIERRELIEKLDELAQAPEFLYENRRRQKLTATLDEGWKMRAAHAIRIPVAADSCYRSMADLPAGVCLADGRLIVEFAGVEDLLSKLYELAQAAANDFERFSAAAAAP